MTTPATSELTKPFDPFQLLDDSVVEEVFAFLGPCYSNVALSSARFHRILEAHPLLPCCDRPELHHPGGETLMLDACREYLWTYCEGSVNDPGCRDGCDGQEENDLVRENHKLMLMRFEEDQDVYSIDSMDWCDQHCGCGYGDDVYSYCISNRSLMTEFPRGFNSDS
jgi:hypothetical protein